MCDKKIGVIGGDLRILTAAKELSAVGFEVGLCGFAGYGGDIGDVTRCDTPESAVRGASACVLPMPYTTDGVRISTPLASGLDGSASDISELFRIRNVFAKIPAGCAVLGGRLDDTAKSCAAEFGLSLYDYYESEELMIKNAIPSAEGAVAIAMTALPVTINGVKAAVVGYGRLGKTLAAMLLSLGASVTVFARKSSDLAWAETRGCRACHIRELHTNLADAEVIFNTVPDILLTKTVLTPLRRDVVIIDLASNPGGVDFTAARELDLNAVRALSLPGKVAPVTAGRIITESILSILESVGVNPSDFDLPKGGEVLK